MKLYISAEDPFTHGNFQSLKIFDSVTYNDHNKM